ncbi:MAG: rod shape-determining protein MreD [Prevotella sp.]|nr:rod shape-determining protein MreD [Prevotella sp.]
MAFEILRRLLVFLAFCLAQVLVLNHVQLFHCATPLLYVYFAIIFPRNYPRWASLLWSFALGLCIDMFANMPGVAAGSMTLVAFLQPYLLELFLPRDAEENIKCSAAALGFSNFATLTTILVLVYCLVFFTLETFNFFNWLFWLECVGGSAMLTLVLIFTLERLRK